LLIKTRGFLEVFFSKPEGPSYAENAEKGIEDEDCEDCIGFEAWSE
jgi:hypothetical protein